MTDAWFRALKKSIHAAQSEPRLSAPTSVAAYVWLSVHRWADLARGFLLLYREELYTEAMCLSRPAAELAINAGWVAFGDSKSFPTREARIAAMQEESRVQQKKWWEAMQRHQPEVTFSKKMTDAWTAFCASPAESDLPPDLCARATQQNSRGDLAAQLYDFAFRVDSQSMHSNTRVLVTRGRGETALPPQLVLFNMVSAGRLLFFAASEVLGSPAIVAIRKQLNSVVERKATGARPHPR